MIDIIVPLLLLFPREYRSKGCTRFDDRNRCFILCFVRLESYRAEWICMTRKRGRERERRAGRTWNNVKNPEAEVGVFVTLECIITLRGRINKRDRRCVSRLHTQTSVHYVSQIRVIAFQSQTIYSRPKNFEFLFFSRIKYNHFQIYSHCRFSPLGFSGRFFSRKVNK